MKWFHLLAAALGIICMASASALAAPGSVTERVRAEIMPSFEAMQAAANIHDADAHVAFFAKDPTIIFLAGDKRIFGWKAILDQQRKWWPGGRTKGDGEPPYKLIAGPDFVVLDAHAALLSFVLDAPKTNPDGTRVERTLGVSQLWEKRPEGWRVIYAHESPTAKTPTQ
jgi:ketosteroid isomerase-like protein